jgi:leucyl/phenylalanyl-tRNA--protein transferase
MFTLRPDASKAAFVALVRQLADWGFDFVDCQVHTPHVERFGARAWPRARFLERLRATLARETRRGRWQLAPERVV